MRDESENKRNALGGGGNIVPPLVLSCLAILSPSVLCLCALLVHNVATDSKPFQSKRNETEKKKIFAFSLSSTR